MKPAELAVVALVLLVWLGVIRLFIKKWGKIRTLEPNRAMRTGRPSVSKMDSRSAQNSGSGPIVASAAAAVTSAGNVCGALAAPCKSRLHSFAQLSSIPRLQMSESQTSLCSNSWNNYDNTPFQSIAHRPRINSVFLTSPSRRPSMMQFEPNVPRRYKSAEDLQSVVMQITERQREQRKLSNCSIKGIDEMPKTGPKLSAVAGAVADAMIGLGPSGRISSSRLLTGCSSQSRTSISRAGSICYGSANTVSSTRSTALPTLGIGATGSGNANNRFSPTNHMASAVRDSSFGSTGSDSGVTGNTSEPSNFRPSTGTQYIINNASSSASSAPHTQLLIPNTHASGDATCATSGSFLSVNCAYCRRRMSSSDHCSHCGGLIPTDNRHTALMQSTSFCSHRGSFSSEGSLDGNGAICPRRIRTPEQATGSGDNSNGNE